MPLVDGYFVGLLSGTSVDAIDAALLQIEGHSIRLLHAEAAAIDPTLRAQILHLSECESVSPDSVGRIDRRLGECLAHAVLDLLRASATPPETIRAIGSHGQTIRHRPARRGSGDCGFTWQIGDPNTIAELTGICTVADFRRRDVAAGGQGAPLVPAFHAWAFGSDSRDRIVLNIGGMANISVLSATARGTARGFDTGPGNALLDAWIDRNRGAPYDRGGQWARTGAPNRELLARLLAHEYFALPAPKSTGREEFNLAWLESQFSGIALTPEDVQATLLELTASSIATAITAEVPESAEVFVCGGGAHNAYLMERLRQQLWPRSVEDTSRLGIAPDWVEAALFGWLARQRLSNLPGNLPAVTGALQPAVLGAIYPGRYGASD